MSSSSKPMVVCLTGIPGTGKSTAASELQAQLNDQGKSTLFLNDYPLIETWALKNRHNASKVVWVTGDQGNEIFFIQPGAYQELSVAIARALAEQIRSMIREGAYDAFLLESARGAGLPGLRDRYDEHLFLPLVSVLGDLVQYANVELRVDDLPELLERVTRRFEADPEAAPPAVTLKYVDEVNGVQSAYEQAEELGEMMAINAQIDNRQGREEMQSALALIAWSICQELQTGRNSEGSFHRPEKN